MTKKDNLVKRINLTKKVTICNKLVKTSQKKQNLVRTIYKLVKEKARTEKLQKKIQETCIKKSQLSNKLVK